MPEARQELPGGRMIVSGRWAVPPTARTASQSDGVFGSDTVRLAEQAIRSSAGSARAGPRRFGAGLQRSEISNASNGESRPDANAPGSPVG
jgi:hypothetical protein